MLCEKQAAFSRIWSPIAESIDYNDNRYRKTEIYGRACVYVCACVCVCTCVYVHVSMCAFACVCECERESQVICFLLKCFLALSRILRFVIIFPKIIQKIAFLQLLYSSFFSKGPNRNEKKVALFSEALAGVSIYMGPVWLLIMLRIIIMCFLFQIWK